MSVSPVSSTQPSSFPVPKDNSTKEHRPPKDGGPCRTSCPWACSSPAPVGAQLTQSEWEVLGSSARVGRAEAATLPKATGGHPPAALSSRDCLEKGCLEMKLGELGVHSGREGVRDGKHPEAEAAPSPGGEAACPEFLQQPCGETLVRKVFKILRVPLPVGTDQFPPLHLVRVPSCVPTSLGPLEAE